MFIMPLNEFVRRKYHLQGLLMRFSEYDFFDFYCTCFSKEMCHKMHITDHQINTLFLKGGLSQRCVRSGFKRLSGGKKALQSRFLKLGRISRDFADFCVEAKMPTF